MYKMPQIYCTSQSFRQLYIILFEDNWTFIVRLYLIIVKLLVYNTKQISSRPKFSYFGLVPEDGIIEMQFFSNFSHMLRIMIGNVRKIIIV